MPDQAPGPPPASRDQGGASPGRCRAACRPPGRRPDRRERCPVVMLTGTYDHLTTPDDGRRTADHIKNAHFIEMEDIGHFPMSENHEVFRRHLLQALERIGSRSATAQA
ncbi:alpha/beta fold hydrolase [Geodermatophilus sp. SYSU D00779]